MIKNLYFTVFTSLIILNSSCSEARQIRKNIQANCISYAFTNDGLIVEINKERCLNLHTNEEFWYYTAQLDGRKAKKKEIDDIDLEEKFEELDSEYNKRNQNLEKVDPKE